MKDDIYDAPPTAAELAAASAPPPKDDIYDAPPTAAELAAASPKPEPGLIDKAAGAVKGGAEAMLAGPVGKGLQWVGDKFERYADAPFRAGLSVAQKSNNPLDAVTAAAHQFGQDTLPQTPTGKQLGESAGFNPQPISERHPGWFSDDGKGLLPKKGGVFDVSDAGVVGGLMQPSAWLPIDKVVSVAGKGIGKAAEVAGAAPGFVAKKAAHYLGDVKEANLDHYMKNQERVNAAGAHSVEDIKNSIDTGVDQTTSDAETAAARKKALYDDLEQKYAAKKSELQGATTPLDQAKQFSGTLAQQKSYLESLSQQADDALVRSGKTFKKSDLIDAIDKVGASQGKAIIGDEATAALQKLDATKQRIIGGLPDEFDAKTMRDVLKQLRSDIDFDGGSGEFNSTLNGMRKDFTSSISNALKDAAPEYKAYMNRMSGLAESLGKMNSHFGNDSKAIGSLESLRKGSSPQSKVIEDAMRQHAELNGDKAMLERLDKLRENQATLERMKTQDLRQELFPKEHSALQDASADATMAGDVNNGVKRLSRNSTQGAIRNQGGTVPSIENQRALENLKNTSGIDYQQLIDDKNVADSFATRNGKHSSRMANIGIATGGAIGHALHGWSGATTGAFIGGHVGGLLDKFGGQVVKSGADVTLAVQKMLASPDAQSLGKYAGILRDAVQRNAVPITHALLMQKDPQYRLIMEGQKQ